MRNLRFSPSVMSDYEQREILNYYKIYTHKTRIERDQKNRNSYISMKLSSSPHLKGRNSNTALTMFNKWLLANRYVI